VTDDRVIALTVGRQAQAHDGLRGDSRHLEVIEQDHGLLARVDSQRAAMARQTELRGLVAQQQVALTTVRLVAGAAAEQVDHAVRHLALAGPLLVVALDAGAGAR
jgi:hypothetical protein